MKILKAIKNWDKVRKLQKLEKKINKLFDELQCDELFYTSHDNKLYAIYWDSIFAELRDVTAKKDERIELIIQYREISND